MTTPILVSVGFFVLFFLLYFINKNKRKNNVIPPPPPVTVIPPTPEPTPVPPPPIVNEFCYAHEVAISDSYDTICQSETYVTVYNLMPNACDEPCQFFLTEESCQRNVSSWNSANTYIRCGVKFGYIDAHGVVERFEDCIFK